ncbi:MAG: type II secretion system protein GspG [Planctomycetes bacterium]|nr:type II secretion system protein GspG [Planctomycetota bacterium]
MRPLDILLILISILFATGLIDDHRWGPERRQHRALVRFQQAQLDVIEKSLQAYHERNGKYPSTAEGLEAVPGLRRALLAEEFAPAAPFLEKSSGIRTIHGIPYVYENREGAPPGAFKASPTNIDQKKRRRFWRGVDKSVHVSSLGLQQDVSRVFGRAWLDALLVFSGVVVVFLAIAYVIARNRRAGDRVRGINAMIIVGVAVLLGIITLGFSGGGRLPGGAKVPLPAAIGAYRTDLLETYLATMRGFVAGGALDQASCERIERTLTNEFEAAGALQPPAPEGAGAAPDGE